MSIFLPTGTLLHAGQYRIEQHLASGGFGNTYLATDVNLKAQVAIKEFYIKTINYREEDNCTVSVSNTANLAMFHSLREKFKKEAQRIFKIQHNNVIRVFSLFEEFGTVYYAMDFIEGESLNSRLKRDGALPESLVRSVFTQMLDALDVVHNAGLLHLDIKPHNIMLTNDGVAKLIDFGASKHSNQADATTTTGFAFTPEYAPPELTNQEYDEIGPWTDIYSLGITLYRLLSNAPIPSKREIRMNGAAAFTYSQPVSTAMQQLIVRMTQGASEHRPQSIAELRKLSLLLEEQTEEQTIPNKKIIVTPVSSQKSEQTIQIQTEKSSNQKFKVNGVRFTMIKVFGGTFTMGATAEQGIDAETDEKPAHSVTLSSYYIGETEVTQELWEAVMGRKLWKRNPSYFKGNRRPIECVNWFECQEFLRKLNQLTGKHFRLPTEAEWEFAARGGNKSMGYKYSGSNNIDDVAWYLNYSQNKTHEVATKRPNELGLYDMNGNVWEWCSERFNYYCSSSHNTNSQIHVARGGSWNEEAKCCRVSIRGKCKADSRYYDLGFRLAL